MKPVHQGASIRSCAAVCAVIASVMVGVSMPTVAAAATTAIVTPLVNSDFEQGVPQSAWVERQGSGGELIDGYNPHAGVGAANLCAIDNCNDGNGGPGDRLTQSFTAPGQVVSATLSYWYSIATTESGGNSACADWLTVGLGANGAADPSATRQYCAATNALYQPVSVDVTPFLNAHGGSLVQVQIAGFTNGINPSEFFVDDVALTITYKTTPSAPLNVSSISSCATSSQATLTWAPPQFPLGSASPVSSYTVNGYDGAATPRGSVTVPGNQTSLTVSTNGGTTCYFTVTATNANGIGAAGSPNAPYPYVTAMPSTQSTTGFTLQWGLEPASAPATTYSVFVRDGSGPWLHWQDTAGTSSTVFGFRGHSYSYWVEAFGASATSGAPTGNGQTATTVATGATSSSPFTAAYGVDGYGNLHPVNSPPLAVSGTWPGWKIVRGIAQDNDAQGGQVLDGFGGLHAFGNAPSVSVSAYWSGWDIARGVAMRADGRGGYVLDGFGGLHPAGNAPPVHGTGYWSGWDIARGMALRPDGVSGYVLDGWGGLHPFGGAPNVAATGYWPGWDIARAVVLRPDGNSGYVLDGFGGVHPFGAALNLSGSGYWQGWDIARAIILDPAGTGGYTLDGYGGFHPLGGVAQGVTPNYAGADVMRGGAGA